MAVFTGRNGAIEVTQAPGIAGRYFVRRDPRDDDPAGNVVVAAGAFTFGDDRVGVTTEIAFRSATFGAIGADFDGDATTSWATEKFAAEYRPFTAAERSVLTLEQSAEAQAKAKASAKRQSPWAP